MQTQINHADRVDKSEILVIRRRVTRGIAGGIAYSALGIQRRMGQISLHSIKSSVLAGAPCCASRSKLKGEPLTHLIGAG